MKQYDNASKNILQRLVSNVRSRLASVAFTGSYSDLVGAPTIPTVSNGKLTIQRNGSTINSFTANQSTNVTANITVPTKSSDLENDMQFKPVIELTKAEYDALTEEQRQGKVYMVSDGGSEDEDGGAGGDVSASDVTYDNSDSGLEVNNVQEAIDLFKTLGVQYMNSETIENVQLEIYSGKAPITVPPGKYVVIRSAYRAGSVNNGEISFRIGKGSNAGQNTIYENMLNTTGTYLDYLNTTSETTVSTYVIVGMKDDTKNQNLTVRTQAIKVGL